MRCGEIIRILEELAPRDYACDWDNPGLLAGRRAKGVRKILVAVDADDEAVELAVQGGADMLLTHHPLIFHPLKQINDGDFIGRRLLTLIGADISYYAMHTNFDIAPGCMGDLAAERLGLSGCAPLEVTGTDLRTGTELVGIGKVGRLPQPMTGAEIAGLVKERFGLPFVTAYGLETAAEPVEYVAISPGSGGSMVAPALKSVARVLVTGDIGHPHRHRRRGPGACGHRRGPLRGGAHFYGLYGGIPAGEAGGRGHCGDRAPEVSGAGSVALERGGSRYDTGDSRWRAERVSRRHSPERNRGGIPGSVRQPDPARHGGREAEGAVQAPLGGGGDLLPHRAGPAGD